MLLTADTVLTGRELLRPGWIEVAGTTVAATGSGAPPRPADRDLGAVTVVPGFVDTHVHGGGGADFSARRPGLDERGGRASSPARHHHAGRLSGQRRAGRPAASGARPGRSGRGRADRRHSSRGSVAGRRALRRARSGAAARSGPRRGRAGTGRGPRDDPDGDAGTGARGAVGAIERIVDAGAVAAVGHTEATYEQTRTAIGAGASVGTHLFNAMRPIHHREPGPVIALLEDPRVTVELITDGVHVHGALYRHVARSAGEDRVSLVTDAMAAAGMADGTYRIGSLAVEVADGVAQLAGTHDHRGKHRDHGPGLPVRRRQQRPGPRRRAATRRRAVFDESRTRAWTSVTGAGRRRRAPIWPSWMSELAVVDVLHGGFLGLTRLERVFDFLSDPWCMVSVSRRRGPTHVLDVRPPRQHRCRLPRRDSRQDRQARLGRAVRRRPADAVRLHRRPDRVPVTRTVDDQRVPRSGGVGCSTAWPSSSWTAWSCGRGARSAFPVACWSRSWRSTTPRCICLPRSRIYGPIRAFQLVWADGRGRWPWAADFCDQRSRQPVLGMRTAR